MVKLTDIEAEVLKALGSSRGYVACDGEWRKPAHDLEKAGLADWKGSSWGSQFWEITDAGRAALADGGRHE
ncbi:hypothetical protein [Tardiphaga sp. 709]|uniref:hypothetical protein n=1 Tax=Tardiphaga sp. 709 TaxID=3076039 RepID=UPI0028EDEDFF|nr:hypothetical protein [Tardiphaga sp. 709]WNV09995.1 hypothetical protein RSO67_02000 [Tardiphaga sp. 709]